MPQRTRTLGAMCSHLGVSAAASAAATVRTEELLPGITISVYPPGAAAEPPPYDEMAATVAQAFSTYEPSLWGQGLQPNGTDVCDTEKLEWNLQKTIRLMATVCVRVAAAGVGAASASSGGSVMADWLRAV
jgi:hypothetical protein